MSRDREWIEDIPVLLLSVATLLAQTGCAPVPHRCASQCGDLGRHSRVGTNDQRHLATTTYPYLKPIPNKPGFYFIPDGPGGYIDARGVARGSLVRSPGTGNRFKIP